MSSWKVVHEGGELAGWHGGVESPEALSAFCGSEISFNLSFEFGIKDCISAALLYGRTAGVLCFLSDAGNCSTVLELPSAAFLASRSTDSFLGHCHWWLWWRWRCWPLLCVHVSVRTVVVVTVAVIVTVVVHSAVGGGDSGCHHHHACSALWWEEVVVTVAIALAVVMHAWSGVMVSVIAVNDTASAT